jgi:N-methylhydantoinase B
MNPRTDRPFIWHMFHARGGGGASPVGDGWPTAGEGQAAGGIKFGSIEVTEVRFPLFLKRHEFRPDSAGAGKYRGGVGTEMEMQVEITEPAVANTAGDGVRYAPYGIFGGEDGLPHRYRLISKGRSRLLKTKEVGIPVSPGDVFYIESSGGGGYGDPEERAPEAHAADFADGLVTEKRRRRRERNG